MLTISNFRNNNNLKITLKVHDILLTIEVIFLLEYVIIGIIFIILLIIILEKDKALYFDVINVKIEEATKDITILLEKKLELLTKISKSLNDDSDEAKNVITNISKIKNKKLTIIELEKELYKLKLKI